MRRLLIMFLLGSSALATGCAVGGGYAVSATIATPDLAYVSPGVYVIADWGEPVFYTNSLYYRYHGNTWYRSRYYDRGWVYTTPPPVLRSIDRPYAYVRYRPSQRYRVERDRVRPYYYRRGYYR